MKNFKLNPCQLHKWKTDALQLHIMVCPKIYNVWTFDKLSFFYWLTWHTLQICTVTCKSKDLTLELRKCRRRKIGKEMVYNFFCHVLLMWFVYLIYPTILSLFLFFRELISFEISQIGGSVSIKSVLAYLSGPPTPFAVVYICYVWNLPLAPTQHDLSWCYVHPFTCSSLAFTGGWLGSS